MTTIDLTNLELTGDPQVQNDVFLAAFNSGDGAIFDSLYRDDAISNLSGGPLTGAARTAFIKEFLATKPSLTSSVKAVYSTGDTSLIIVDYDLEMDTPDGQRVHVHGACTDVLRKDENGKWMMAIDRPVADAMPQAV